MFRGLPAELGQGLGEMERVLRGAAAYLEHSRGGRKVLPEHLKNRRLILFRGR